MLGYPHAPAIPGELKGYKNSSVLLVNKKSSWFCAEGVASSIYKKCL